MQPNFHKNSLFKSRAELNKEVVNNEMGDLNGWGEQYRIHKNSNRYVRKKAGISDDPFQSPFLG